MNQVYACIYDIKNRDYKKAIIDGLNRIKFKNIIKSDDTVLIKPNFTWPEYKKGVTTSPYLLDHLTSILKNFCGDLYIGESDGANCSWTADQCFKGHGLLEIAKKNGFELINLSKKPTIFKNLVNNGRNMELKVSKFILDKIDVLITVPVLKTHAATIVSLGLKNQWGCLPDPMRLLYHPFLHKGIVAVNKLYNPKISIIDATYGLNGSGPIFGNPIKLNKILISNNTTVLDMIACSFMGIPYERIKHIQMAKNELLHDIDIDKIKRYGDFNTEFKFRMIRSTFDKIAVFIMYRERLNNFLYNSYYSKMIQKFLNFYKTLFKKESLHYN